jgi:hypothetical protein
VLAKYLYLDFDGVLHPNSFDKGKAFCLMPMLERALNGSDVRIVVSSSWRHHESKAYIQSLFPASIRSLLSGFTGDPLVGRWTRWNEISNHAAVHGVTEWRALDDAVSEFPPHCPNLIACEGHIGLQELQINLLRKWIQGSSIKTGN